MKHSRILYFGVLLSLLLGSQLLAVYSKHRSELNNNQKCGRYTSKQAIDQCTPLIDALLPMGHTEPLTSSLPYSAIHPSKVHPLFEIDSNTISEHAKVQVILDTTTGRLRQITWDGIRSPHPQKSACLSMETVTAKAIDWMHLIDPTGSWHLIDRPTRIDATWHVILSSNGYRARLSLDDTDAQLIYADVATTETAQH